ncbi:SpoVR family protein [Paenibacillus mucilaginosus]|uniref:SpoVR2 n=2 Tax=Paenibacillus mucilaginosus TaxID=61624 RepID=H6NK64_9BACL|nr:SpoVR family protein [Paenibacillus mucilaginosus]AEI43963.1 SpoVR2 [Paenibacillus mucilaginosus KNP414]AFC31548.1 SpoVR2 [Paenibacillus mucilaginosus 3016]MCG7212541.1 SpoVR family protein [Paenibacillus mucilaginosus]WDM25429.1 SpoVR family protein [Paenibacillus mucilaginosus]WFA20087.1 stage V sporulation protein R [Paenibacillus mucilaginosus]
MHTAQLQALEHSIAEITEMAVEEGLDFFPMRYEICPAEVLYSIGAYGMPTRFAHWSFGKAYQRMKSAYDHGLSVIYELVINSDPCYAFLLDRNTLLQNKLIVAHVLGHSDFFKNNAMFSRTDRGMVERMAVFADRMRIFEQAYGSEEVEKYLDAGLAIQEHIDPHERFGREGGFRETEGGTKDVIGFIASNSRMLEDWQREILYMLRGEMHYFWPQMETKILNEGWATFWHLRLLRRLALEEEEILEFAKMNAGVIQTAPGRVNPYHLGLRMLEYVERREGLEALFELRETESDVSFLRGYLSRDMVEEMDLFLFERQDRVYRVTDKETEKVRDTLIRERANGGFPYITAMDDDYQGRGELLLLHRYEGLELDRKYVDRTLPLVHRLWGKPVHLETRGENQRTVRYSCDGQRVAAG